MPYRHPTGNPIERLATTAHVVRESIDIAAPAAEVFNALSDPCQLAEWLAGDAAPSPSDANESQAARELETPAPRWAARVVAPDGTIGWVTGEYGSVVPPHRLETTWCASWNDFAPERVCFDLLPIDVGGMVGTRVTVTHTRALTRMLAPSGAFARSIVNADVWPSVLARLAAHVVSVQPLARSGVPGDAARDTFEALHRAVVELHHAH
jgi:uncharacterized protein YndB with AHSA1/START domain